MLKQSLILLISLMIFGNAQASTCEDSVVAALLKKAAKVSDATGYQRQYKVRKLGLEELQAKVDKAKTYTNYSYRLEHYIPVLQETSRVLNILSQNPQPSYVAYELTWKGWVYDPTNIDVDIYHAILVDERHCEALTPITTYFNTFLNEKLSWLPAPRGRDW